MKDERKEIDELFSDGLGNFSPAPPPDLWDRIGTGLPASGPAPETPVSGWGRLPVIGIAAAIIAGLALLWFLTGQYNPVTEKNNTTQQHEMPLDESSNAVSAEIDEKGKSASAPAASNLKNTSEIHKNRPELVKKSATQQTEESEIILRQTPTVSPENRAERAITPSITNPVKVSSDESLRNVATLSELRLDFTNWLDAQTANFESASATSAFSDHYIRSPKPSMPKGSGLPVIGGIYTSYDIIDYGKGFKKQSRAAGLSLTTFKGPWVFETGAALCLSDDNGRFVINYGSYDSIGYYNKVVSFSLSPDNPGTVLFNTEVQGVYDSIDHALETTTTNRYTYLQIPLMVGYHLYNNRLITISFKAGPVMSLMLGSEEPTATFNQDGANLQSIDNLSPSRVTTNWQIAVGLGVGLHLSRRFTLLAEPTYKTYLRPVYRNTRTKPQSVGIKAGLLYRF